MTCCPGRRRLEKLLLVGEADPPCGVPLLGRSGRFLAGLLGMRLPEFLLAVDAVNLLPKDGDKLGKGRRFGPGEVLAGTAAAAGLRLEGRVVGLLGRRVGRCFGVRDTEFLKVVRLGRDEAAAVVFPHPSGIVRWWNDREKKRAAAAVLAALVRIAGEGL